MFRFDQVEAALGGRVGEDDVGVLLHEHTYMYTCMCVSCRAY